MENLTKTGLSKRQKNYNEKISEKLYLNSFTGWGHNFTFMRDWERETERERDYADIGMTSNPRL